MSAWLDLVDYRRRVAAIYAGTRDATIAHEQRWHRFVSERDHLFGGHPQSPLPPETRSRFAGLPYFPYDPAFRTLADWDDDVAPAPHEIRLADDGAFTMTRIARLRFALHGRDLSLAIYWIEGYGGGLFVPFGDASNGDSTYGGGRYLLDTIKHADLGSEGGRLVLDFNFAYHPSCRYSPRWDCPLAPPENRLPLAVTAGERLEGDPESGPDGQ